MSGVIKAGTSATLDFLLIKMDQEAAEVALKETEDEINEGITARTGDLELLNTAATDQHLDYVELYDGASEATLLDNAKLEQILTYNELSLAKLFGEGARLNPVLYAPPSEERQGV